MKLLSLTLILAIFLLANCGNNGSTTATSAPFDISKISTTELKNAFEQITINGQNYRIEKVELWHGLGKCRDGLSAFVRVAPIDTNSELFSLELAFIWIVTSDGVVSSVFTESKVDKGPLAKYSGFDGMWHRGTFADVIVGIADKHDALYLLKAENVEIAEVGPPCE